jgi:hypothetical protein
VLIERDIDFVDYVKDVPTYADQVRLRIDEVRSTLEDERLPKDKWLSYDAGWLATERHDWKLAAATLEPIVKDFRGSLFELEVWEKLALAYVNLERTTDEIHAYDEVVALASYDAERLTPMLNRAEAKMRAGDAEHAAEDFREVRDLAVRVPNASDISVLAQWDLTLALDRSGEPARAMAEAKGAVQMDGQCVAVSVESHVNLYPSCVTSAGAPLPEIAFILVPAGLVPISKYNTHVYFVPDYEREWYLALGHEALARDGGTTDVALANWRDAEASMMEYVSKATIHGGDRWLDLSRTRLDEIRKRRAAAESSAAKAKKP